MTQCFFKRMYLSKNVDFSTKSFYDNKNCCEMVYENFFI